MRDNSTCEVCGADSWVEMGYRVYSSGVVPLLSPYEQKRFRVLFEVWFPGKPEVTLRSVGCRNCGFVCYLPRPEKADIGAKYRALAQMGEHHGCNEDEVMCAQRAQRLFETLRRRLPDRKMDVLDFGGGDGRLMHPFLDRGHRCFLLDYNQQPVAGVQKLGDTVEDLEMGRLFDLIVCSHVIEHVAEPTVLLRRLAGHVKPDHHLFIEVPMEIWRKPPLQPEPVTHINFFVPNSLRRCMEEAGLMVGYSRLSAYLHESGRIFPAIHALGRRCDVAVPQRSASGWNELTLFLQPSFLTRLQRVWALRENLAAMAAYKFGIHRKFRPKG